MSTISLEALTVPEDDPLPLASKQELIDEVVRYIRIVGLESVNFFNYGTSTPAVGDRDKPWFRLDSSTNRPLGWHWWDGSQWSVVSPFVQRGSTIPANPVQDEKYYHTSINARVIYDAGWKLDDGAPAGSLKFADYDPSIAIGTTGDFAAGTYDTVLGLNPGYAQFASATNRVLIAAGTRNAREAGGAETHSLTAQENGPHTHTQKVRDNIDTNNPGSGVLGGTIQSNLVDGEQTGSSGSGDPHNNMQPYYVSWLLKKQ